MIILITGDLVLIFNILKAMEEINCKGEMKKILEKYLFSPSPPGYLENYYSVCPSGMTLVGVLCFYIQGLE